MSDSPNDMAADRSMFPMFYLTDVGGVSGIRRWLQLYERHPLAVEPISNYLRYGSPSAQVQLLEVATAIEQWVGAHARSAKWAKKRNSKSYAEALACHIGTPFTDWAGPSDIWSARFWKSYKDLKHH